MKMVVEELAGRRSVGRWRVGGRLGGRAGVNISFPEHNSTTVRHF